MLAANASGHLRCEPVEFGVAPLYQREVCAIFLTDRSSPTQELQMEEESMNKIFKAGTTFAVASLMVGGIAVGGASAGTSVQNVPGSASVTAATAAPRVFAVVNADATLLRGKGVTSTTHLGPGVYDIRFARNISTCAWTGTVGFGTFSGSTGAAQITITGRSATNNGLFVTTFNGAGVATDEPFAAVVLCS